MTPSPMPAYRAISWATFLLCFVVVVFGAFVRLSDAGLGCPDWPTCYGQATWPTEHEEVQAANQAFPQRPVESHKAWREQVHRHLAATLGTLVLLLAFLSARGRRFGRSIILAGAATVVVAVVLHIVGLRGIDTSLVILAECLLIAFAATAPPGHLSRLTALTLAVVIFQAILGMWTVTWLLKPLVVTGHLLGGLTTLALLLWNLLSVERARRPLPAPVSAGLRNFALVALLVLAIQIFLGGWTSTNYAALACPDFPTCQGRWVPDTDVGQAYQLWRGIGTNYEFGVLDNRARMTIHFFHRIGALVTTGVVLALAFGLWRESTLRRYAVAVLGAVLLQVAIGISIVELQLPLGLATAHNGGAALLLVVLVILNHRLRWTPAGQTA